MKYSIRKKMFIISISTTMLSFLLIMVCFNFICSNYIEKESSKELSSVMATAITTPATSFPASENLNGTTAVPSNAASVSSISIATNLERSLKEPQYSQDIEFILTDPEKEMVIYPNQTALPVSLGTFSAVNIADAIPTYDNNVVSDIQQFTLKNQAITPMKTVLHNTSYYVVEMPLGDGTNAVFYKNVQSLEDLVKDVNLALLGLLLLCGIITIAASMVMSNGMVLSIRRLCRFAGDIGNGKFEQQELHLKESELSVLEQDMNEMAKRLSQYDAEQKTFFQNVSHELRTPLMSIQGYAEGITSHVFEKDEIESAAGVIVGESERLAGMVSNLLYLSRIDSKQIKMKKKSFDCIEAVCQALDQAETASVDKTISYVQHGDSFPITGDCEELTKAFLNIVINCTRYAKEETSVICRCQERIIEISDDGPGISEKDLPHIFKRFYKGAGGHSGIGLAIAQAVAEEHGGTIMAENENGAKFIIKL